MDARKLDDVFLLHWSVHDRHLRWPVIHADAAEVRAEDTTVHVERVLGGVLHLGGLPQCPRAPLCAQQPWLSLLRLYPRTKVNPLRLL